MLITAVKIIAIAWLAYSVWRAIAASRNAIETSTEALATRLFFTGIIWQAHAREEISALTQVMLTRYENSDVSHS